MPIDRFLNEFTYDPETFNADDFKAAALAEFEKDRGSWAAKVSQQDEALTAARAENTNLKATNYDLLNKVPADPGTKTPADQQVEKDPTDLTIDDLFGTE